MNSGVVLCVKGGKEKKKGGFLGCQLLVVSGSISEKRRKQMLHTICGNSYRKSSGSFTFKLQHLTQKIFPHPFQERNKAKINNNQSTKAETAKEERKEKGSTGRAAIRKRGRKKKEKKKKRNLDNDAGGERE
jgi:hypothetical protein